MRLLIFLVFLVPAHLMLGHAHEPMIRPALPVTVCYQSLQDREGFLWVATDQGVFRFDGHQANQYAREHGVPDVEITQLQEDARGRIWILCYNGHLAVFLPKKNAFWDVTSLFNAAGARKIRSLQQDSNADISFVTETGTYQLQTQVSIPHWIQAAPGKGFLLSGNQWYYRQMGDSLELSRYQQQRCVFTVKQPLTEKSPVIQSHLGQLFIFDRNQKNYRVLQPSDNNNHCSEVIRTLMHPYYHHQFSGSQLVQLHRTYSTRLGKDILTIWLYHLANGRFNKSLEREFQAFHWHQDREGNEWVSTIDSGLCLFRTPPPIRQIAPPAYQSIVFYSLGSDQQGRLLAGNEKGEVLSYDGQYWQRNQVPTPGKTEWQRQIVHYKNQVYVFSDGGIVRNYSEAISDQGKQVEVKVICRVNDTLIYTGSGSGFYALHLHTGKLRRLPQDKLEITALAARDTRFVLVGTTQGLYRYDTESQKMGPYLPGLPEAQDRITSLCYNRDGLLWAGTANSGLLIIREGQLLGQLRESDGLLSNNIQCLLEGKTGECWIGSTKGISRVSFIPGREWKLQQIQNMTTLDGLPSPVIYQMIYLKGRVYAATERGVAFIPDTVARPQIPVVLTRIQVNGRDTILQQQYSLKAHERALALWLPGIDLLGYYHHTEYSDDEGGTWKTLNGPNLNIEFEHGQHRLWARAVDVNGNAGKHLLKLEFDIATPFWKTWWFWTLSILSIQGLLAYGFYRRHKRREAIRRTEELARAQLASLEQQAFVSLMNPHFMFNSLNSIQHYINHQDRQNANRYLSDFASLIRKNFEAAQQAFIPLETEMENIDIYLRLERMRFHEKFSTHIEYAEGLDPEDWMMPTMIIQPLVENAILHGLMPSGIPGELWIRLKLEDDDLVLEITDNGIGIANSRALKQGSTHKSRGMELIHKRLQALSFFSAQTLTLSYDVPFDDPVNPGSRTRLLIPADMYPRWKKAQQAMRTHTATNAGK